MRNIEAVQLAHTESDMFPTAGYCRDCGGEWPCDVAVVLAAWDADSERQIDNAVALTTDRLARTVRELPVIWVKGEAYVNRTDLRATLGVSPAEPTAAAKSAALMALIADMDQPVNDGGLAGMPNTLADPRDVAYNDGWGAGRASAYAMLSTEDRAKLDAALLDNARSRRAGNAAASHLPAPARRLGNAHPPAKRCSRRGCTYFTYRPDGLCDIHKPKP